MPDRRAQKKDGEKNGSENFARGAHICEYTIHAGHAGQYVRDNQTKPNTLTNTIARRHLEQEVPLGAHVGVEDDDELRPGDEVGRVVRLLYFEFEL